MRISINALERSPRGIVVSKDEGIRIINLRSTILIVMDLASKEEDEEAASSILLNAIAIGHMEKEINRLQISRVSSYAECMAVAGNVSIDEASTLKTTNYDEGGGGGEGVEEGRSGSASICTVDYRNQSIFRKTVCDFPLTDCEISSLLIYKKQVLKVNKCTLMKFGNF